MKAHFKAKVNRKTSKVRDIQPTPTISPPIAGNLLVTVFPESQVPPGWNVTSTNNKMATCYKIADGTENMDELLDTIGYVEFQ